MKIILIFLCLVFFCIPANADSGDDDVVIYVDYDQLREDAMEYYKISTATFSAFTAQTSIVQGSFTFQNEGLPDGRFDVFKLPIPYYFNKDQSYQPFIQFTYGNSKYTQKSIINIDGTPFEEDIGKENTLDIKTHTFSFTTGIRWEYMKGFSIEPSIGLAYSHLKYKEESDTLIYQRIIEEHPSLYRDYFDTTVDIYSLIPSLKHSISYSPGFGTIGFNLHYMYQYSSKLRSKSRYADISANSSMLNTMLDYEIPTGYAIFDRDLAVKPFIARTDFFGDVREGMDLDYLHEFGLNFIVDVGNFHDLFSRLQFGGSYITGHDFQGWKFGLSFL